MKLTKAEKNGVTCALVSGSGKVITDVQTAIDLLMSAQYGLGTKNIVIDKAAVDEDFFSLSTGLAGEVLQKYINYGGRIAVYGDYSCYDSKSLKDFIYECNKGTNIFFAATEEEAVDMLTGRGSGK